MSAEAPIVTRTFRVGKFQRTLSFRAPPARLMTAEWSPYMPQRGQLSPKNLRQYQRARDATAEEFAALTGLNVVVIE